MQGITGKVLWKTGNLMPGPGAKPSEGSPVVREIYIYELTSQKQTESAEESGFYQKINSKLVKIVKSDKKGVFSAALPTGYYSLLVKEEKGLYANLFDDAMNLNPVQIRKGKWTKFDISIDYQAVY
ncbi:MAG: carboxypeptidase regulatory-like domain-containing protein [Spirosomataceae bacterium]